MFCWPSKTQKTSTMSGIGDGRGRGRAPQREATTKHKNTTKTDIADRQGHPEDNIHYPIWNKTHFKEKIIFLEQKTTFYRVCRNFGQTRKHPLARKNTMGVRDGIIGGAIKRHAAKESRKSPLSNESFSIFKKLCEKHPVTHAEIFFHRNFERGSCENETSAVM